MVCIDHVKFWEIETNWEHNAVTQYLDLLVSLDGSYNFTCVRLLIHLYVHSFAHYLRVFLRISSLVFSDICMKLYGAIDAKKLQSLIILKNSFLPKFRREGPKNRELSDISRAFLGRPVHTSNPRRNQHGVPSGKISKFAPSSWIIFKKYIFKEKFCMAINFC